MCIRAVWCRSTSAAAPLHCHVSPQTRPSTRHCLTESTTRPPRTHPRRGTRCPMGAPPLAPRTLRRTKPGASRPSRAIGRGTCPSWSSGVGGSAGSCPEAPRGGGRALWRRGVAGRGIARLLPRWYHRGPAVAMQRPPAPFCRRIGGGGAPGVRSPVSPRGAVATRPRPGVPAPT